MTPAEQTFTLLEESQGQVQITTWCLSHTEVDGSRSININIKINILGGTGRIKQFCCLNVWVCVYTCGCVCVGTVQARAAFRGQRRNVTPEQDCFCPICLSNICSICGMKAVSFLRSWLEISVCPPCLSVPAPNRYKDQPYRKYLQLPVHFTRPGAAEGSLYVISPETPGHYLMCFTWT